MEELLRTCIVLVIIPVGIVSLLYKIICIKREMKKEQEGWDEYLKGIELRH